MLLPGSDYADLLVELPAQQHSPGVEEVTALARRSIVVLEEMVTLAEAQERQGIDAEVGRRRTRLTGVPMSAEATRKAVECEVLPTSRLPALYEQVLSHPQASDEARRAAESKLLRHTARHMHAVPDPFAPVAESALSEVQLEQRHAEARAAGASKDRLRAQIEELTRGMVLLRFPDELAWRVTLEWADAESLGPSTP